MDHSPDEPASDDAQQTSTADSAKKNSASAKSITLLIMVAIGIGFAWLSARETPIEPLSVPTQEGSEFEDFYHQNPRRIMAGTVNSWWDAIPTDVPDMQPGEGTESNISPDDYSGSKSCQKCHKKNYTDWSTHAHRWMNAIANTESVKGDFSGKSDIHYLGGHGTFSKVDGHYRMTMERDGTKRVYDIDQTIGSRFFQYYVGKLIEGPEPSDHLARQESHVLPFGYWLEYKEWVPTVHIGDERAMPDGKRDDPFDPPKPGDEVSEHFQSLYARYCNQCHSTFSFGNMLVRAAPRYGRYFPHKLHINSSQFLAQAHPSIWSGEKKPSQLVNVEVTDIFEKLMHLDSPSHAVEMGITCEACHLGAKQHALGKLKKPSFLPMSPLLKLEASSKVDPGRTPENVNWICGRCHSGTRPHLAAGMSTWNSTEYDDFALSRCASELTCIDCHNPHKTIGPRWTNTADADDASCMKCHDEYRDADTRAAHTHHSAGSTGDRCMNCHMPHLNEGLQDVVRTHMIYSPNRRDMIRANQPNACNMCHTEKSIRWTLDHFQKWYDDRPSSSILTKYDNPDQPAILEWLEDENESVRMFAAGALIRSKSFWALEELSKSLDDPFLLNRQFALKGLEDLLEVDLDDFGYRFYMTPQERAEPLSKIRAMLKKHAVAAAQKEKEKDR